MIDYTIKKQKIVDEAERRERLVFIRMYIVFGICVIGFAVVLARAVYLHVAQHPELNWIAKKQYNAYIPLSVRLGKLFDRNGAELAISLPVPSVYVDPQMVNDPEATARELAGLLHLDEKGLANKIGGHGRFVWIKRRISYETLEKVLALKLPGVNYVEESKRFYPNGELASQILGAVGYDSQALAGLEMAYNDILKSRKISSFYRRDARGKLYATPVGFGEQSDVGDVYLTIDKQIQFITENALRKAVQKSSAKDGVAVVMDPRNGDILAMASAPRFDPNRYSKYPVANWRNRAVTDAFEPGSTFKIFIVAAALESGIVNTESTYNCEGGAIKIGKDILKDHHPYHKLSVQDIIKYSSNIGALKVAFDLGGEGVYKALKRFGIGSKTGIDYPGEISGVLRGYETWQPVEQATVAFGQGLSTTPIQMTAAFAAAINGGILYRPHLVARYKTREGEVVQNGPEVVSHPVRKSVSDTVRYMLKRVVEKGGTGVAAASTAYTIGGKTGTAQKVVQGRGYTKGKYFASFIGFAPVDDPKLVVFVGIDEPRGAYYGGTVAAPVVKEIVELSLNYMDVPSAVSKVMYTAEKASPFIEPAEDYGEVRPRTEFIKVADGRYVMPDLAGLTMREILTSTQEIDVGLDAEGSGIAVLQNPKAGSVVERGGKFSVRFEVPR